MPVIPQSTTKDNATSIHQWKSALIAALAAIALTACGGGGDTLGIEDATAATRASSSQLLVASSTTQFTLETLSLVNSDGLALPAYLWRPSGNTGTVPTVVMLHGCSGIYSYSDPTKGISSIHTEWAKRLTAAGYAALLVDSYSPRGTQNECNNGTRGVNEAVDRPKDALAAQTWLVNNLRAPANRIALLGWSNGASATLATMDMSHANGGRPFVEAFALYPGCGLLNEFGGVSNSTWLPYAPVTIHHGTLDALYTDGKCMTRVTRAQGLGASTATGNAVALITYTDAHHSFDLTKNPPVLPYTSADVDAKVSTDASVMARLATVMAN